MVTEDELIEGCIANKREYQKLLYEKYCNKMLAVCFRYCQSREEAEDVVQDAFIKVFKNIATFQKLGPLDAWIRRIMVNTALGYIRARKREIDFADIEKVNFHPESEFNTISEINAKDLTNLIGKLPDGYRMIFNMFVIEGFSHQEIADQLGISEGTSKSQLAKARNWLKKNININLEKITLDQSA